MYVQLTSCFDRETAWDVFAGTLHHPNSLTVKIVNDVSVTILFFQAVISLLVTILIYRMDEIYRYLIYIYYTLSAIIFPPNACIHSLHVINIFISEQKNLFYTFLLHLFVSFFKNFFYLFLPFSIFFLPFSTLFSV